VLLEALKLLHPVMPFITEEIASHLGSEAPLITTPYPAAGRFAEDPRANAVMGAFQAVVQETRSYRHLVGLPPGTPLELFLVGLDPARREAFSRLATELCRLAGLSTLELNPSSVPEDAIRDLAGGVNVAIVLPEGALGEAERARLAAELAQVKAELEKATSRLSDASFTSRAPEDVVAGSRERAAELEHKARLLTATLERRR
jgi:valyl-tRNA synthetase